MSFEVIEDRYGNNVRPMEWETDLDDRMGVIFLIPRQWGGVTRAGIYLDHEQEDLPACFGVVYTILHSSPLCVLNLPREQGGLMPGDLVMYTRHATMRVTEVSLESDDEGDAAWRALGVQTRKPYPLYALAESEVQCRIDGILSDPWREALLKLEPAKEIR